VHGVLPVETGSDTLSEVTIWKMSHGPAMSAMNVISDATAPAFSGSRTQTDRTAR